MKQVKYVLMALIALSLNASANAQTSSSKKAKATKLASAVKYQCPMKCEGDKTYAKEGKCPECNMKLKALPVSAATAAYQCPMKCEGEKTYAKEGKCPECNMKLAKVDTKKKATSHDGHNHK